MDSLNFLFPIESTSFNELRGDLSAVEIPDSISFQTKRIYYISNVPSDSIRGAHAHKELKQIFIALLGSFTLKVTDGNKTDQVKVSSRSTGYFLPSGFWRELSDFSEDAICLVLASEHFDEKDYLKEMSDYLVWKKSHES
jgi:dTDP-4-dehydrorhamnose 3,5-epimerase-like enzyme